MGTRAAIYGMAAQFFISQQLLLFYCEICLYISDYMIQVYECTT